MNIEFDYEPVEPEIKPEEEWVISVDSEYYTGYSSSGTQEYTESSIYCGVCGQWLDNYGNGHHPWCSFNHTFSPPPTQYGWCCPRCNRVYAPSVFECWSCNSHIK